MANVKRLGVLFGWACGVAMATAAPAQLYWKSPDFSGTPVTGTETGLVQPLAGATPVENDANLLWTLRAGLNVAALQCQFSPALDTVDQYNDVIAHHAKELNAALATLTAYYKRTDPKHAQNAVDQYTTRTYNSFSTLHAQYGFCQTASNIGYDAIATPKGGLIKVARARLREFRNSLVPQGDQFFTLDTSGLPASLSSPVDRYPPECIGKKGKITKECLKIYG